MNVKLPAVAALAIAVLSSCVNTTTDTTSSGVSNNLPGDERRQASKVAVQVDETSRRVQPHILWIITDDQRADSVSAVNKALRGTENSELGYVESPSLDALAAEGVLFPLAFSQSPGCSPSRYSMHTGQYPHRSGRYGFEYSHRQNPNAQQTIPEVLRESGYQTMLAGKLGLRVKNGVDVKGSPRVYDYQVERYALEHAGIGDWTKRTIYDWEKGKSISVTESFHYPDGTKEDFEFSRGGKLVEGANPSDEKLQIVRSYTRSNPTLILAGESPMPEDKTTDARILQAFQKYLNHPNTEYTSILGDQITGPSDDKPVMASLSFHFPHTPVLPPKAYQDRFETYQYKLPKFNKEDVDKLPKQLKELYNEMKSDELTDAEKLRTIQDYYAFTAYGDSLIGKAVKDFKQFSKESGRPYLIIATVGDHGWHLGEQGISAKFGPWYKSSHGALIVVDSSGEYFPRNSVHSEFIEYVDIAPTLYAAAGIDVKNDYSYLDGSDLSRVIREQRLKRDYVLGELNQIVGDRVYLRSERFAFSMKIRPKNGKPGESHRPGEDILWAINANDIDVEMALYDMKCDPDERNNVAYEDTYNPITTILRNKTQNIFLGDQRIEVDWNKQNDTYKSNFAKGAHDRSLKELNNYSDIACEH